MRAGALTTRRSSTATRPRDACPRSSSACSTAPSWRGRGRRAPRPRPTCSTGSGRSPRLITAVLVMQCRDDGLIDLDDPIGKHVPGDRLRVGDGAVAAGPRLRHAERAGGAVVGAVSGHCDGRPARGQRWFGRGVRAGGALPLQQPGFALLGEAVARRRDADWFSLAEDRVLAPLGMTRTSYLPQEPYARGLSVHHLANTLTPEPMHDTGAMAPAGQLWSTVEDLAQFAAFLSLGNSAVLADRTLIEMRRPCRRRSTTASACAWCRTPTGCSRDTRDRCPASRQPSSSTRSTTVGVVALTNATTGFSGTDFAIALLGDRTPVRHPVVESRRDGARLGTRAARLLALGQHGLRGPLAGRPAGVARPVGRCRSTSSSSCARTGSSGSPATTTARPCTSYDATTARSTTSSARRSCTPGSRTTR